jgi:hypothetical protein
MTGKEPGPAPMASPTIHRSRTAPPADESLAEGSLLADGSLLTEDVFALVL